jgi:hypothetical protein
MIGVSTNAGSVRINPVGLNRVAGLLHAMGIVRLGERDAVRIVTDTREREGLEASKDPWEIGRRPVVVGAPSREIVTMDGARHNAANRTRVRGDPPSEGEARPAS